METTEKLENDTQNETSTTDTSNNSVDTSENIISIDKGDSILVTDISSNDVSSNDISSNDIVDTETLIWFHKDVKQSDKLILKDDITVIPSEFTNIEELNLDKNKKYKLALVYHQTRT